MELANWDKWSEWQKLSPCPLEVPVGCGAYIIATRIAIHRAVGIDTEGILDIGESKNLRGRIKSFIACANGRRPRGHMAGWRYKQYEFEKHFPLDTLFIRWHPTQTKEEAYAIEGKILQTYLIQHKELPPLNYKFNWPQYAE